MRNSKIKNPIQKLLAVSFAIIIWAFAPSPNKNLTEVKFFVPVSYVNLPKNLEITSEPLQSISVSVEIPRSELQQNYPSLFRVVIDLEDAIPGENEFNISRNALKIPDNVKILEIVPNQLNLTFEETMEKDLPIKPVFIGEPARGYVLEHIDLIPDSVKVRGLVSVLSKIQQLESKAINIEAIDIDQDFLIYLNFPEGVTAMESEYEHYTLRIKVGSEPISKRFLKIPIGIINQTYVTRLNPRVFNVVLRGPRSLMQDFTKQDIQAFIDLQSYRPGDHQIETPTLRLPPEIQLQKSWPPIRIWVKKQKID